MTSRPTIYNLKPLQLGSVRSCAAPRSPVSRRYRRTPLVRIFVRSSQVAAQFVVLFRIHVHHADSSNTS